MAILKYLGTLTLTPDANSRLERITLFFGGDDYHSSVAATEAWWSRSLAASAAALEIVLLGLVEAFSLAGIHIRCDLDFDAEESRYLLEVIFPNLSETNWMIFESEDD